MKRLGDDVRRRAAAAAGRLILLACLLAAGGAAAGAQTNTGELGGVVRDESGAVLPGATVVATHADGGWREPRLTIGSLVS